MKTRRCAAEEARRDYAVMEAIIARESEENVASLKTRILARVIEKIKEGTR